VKRGSATFRLKMLGEGGGEEKSNGRNKDCSRRAHYAVQLSAHEFNFRSFRKKKFRPKEKQPTITKKLARQLLFD
jgi:hypothetical protein